MSENEEMAFDPDQDPEQKRALRKNYRALQRKVEEQHADPNNFDPREMIGNLRQGDKLFRQVRGTQEAVLDSRVLLLATSAGAAKARSMKSGSGAFDVDDFVAKLVGFMGGHGRVRRGNVGSDDEAAYDYEPLEWHKIGRKALAKSRRVPALSFMLGPLSIEQKKRAHAKRTKYEKNTAAEVKPQELKEEDIQRSENETVQNVSTLSQLLEASGTVNLFRFVINPKDFAQSVENLFYLSFLIRDGKVALETQDGEPVIYACDAPTDEDYKEGLKKQQLVFEFDMQVWKKAIEVFDIKEPMIPSRPPAKVKLGKWYG